jgi:hypothetical protein
MYATASSPSKALSQALLTKRSNPSNFPLRNSDGATYASLKAQAEKERRYWVRMEAHWNEARDWAEWGWYHEAKAQLQTIATGGPLDRRQRVNLYTPLHLVGD